MVDTRQKEIPADTDERCKHCKHFRQHYIKFGKSYREILYGHCVYPRLKKRNTDSPACNHYKSRE